MPNWTENTLEIKGNEKYIAKFKKLANSKELTTGVKTVLSFNSLYPMPKELDDILSPPVIVSEKEYRKAIEKKNYGEKIDELKGIPITKKISQDLKKKFGADNWYDWSNKHWGTKWDTSCATLLDNKKKLQYNFSSAWSPPVAWLQKVSKDFPELSFTLKFDEPAMGYRGEVKAKNGEIYET